MSIRISLDTNILVYSIDIDAKEKHIRAVEIMRQTRQVDCVLTVQALAEFFVVVTRKQKMPIDEAVAQIEDWQLLFPLVGTSPESLQAALQAVQQHHFSFWDAMLWASVQQAGVTLLLSEDCQHQRIFEHIQFYNPFLDECFDLQNLI